MLSQFVICFIVKIDFKHILFVYEVLVYDNIQCNFFYFASLHLAFIVFSELFKIFIANAVNKLLLLLHTSAPARRIKVLPFHNQTFAISFCIVTHNAILIALLRMAIKLKTHISASISLSPVLFHLSHHQ